MKRCELQNFSNEKSYVSDIHVHIPHLTVRTFNCCIYIHNSYTIVIPLLNINSL